MIVGDDLHLPVGKPVKVLLRSIDVLHDFYVPEFRAKMDMVPGMVTYFWFTPTQNRNIRGLSAPSYAASGTRNMRGKVVVDEESDYQAWLQKQQTFAQLSARNHQGVSRTRASGTKRICTVKLKPSRRQKKGRRVFRWSMSRLAQTELSRLPKSTKSSFTIRKSWVTKYVFCQDAKVIAIQYSMTAMAIGLVALVLSWLMRLQLGFPAHSPSSTRAITYQFITMHGMIMVIYLLTALFLGRLWQLPDPADGGRPGHGFPLCEHAELLGLSASGAGTGGELLRAGRADGRRLDPVPAPGHPLRHAGAGLGHHSDARLSDPVHHRLHDGRVELCGDGIAGRAHAG